MNMESQPNNRNLTNEDLKRESRRDFLKGVAAGVGVAAYGAVKINKYLENDARETETDKLAEIFKNREEDFSFATEAMSLLIHEMKIEGISTVKMSGTGHENIRINYLRDFITKHLNSKKVSTKYTSDTRGKPFADGHYSKESLLKLIGEANNIINRIPIPNIEFNKSGHGKSTPKNEPKKDGGLTGRSNKRFI